jgi:hypothetical protein
MRTYGYRWHVAEQMLFTSCISMAWHTRILRTSLTAVAIIDFNGSVRVKGAGHIFHGIAGTNAYILRLKLQLVKPSHHSAIRTDLWSCVPGVCRPEIATRCSR